MPAHGELPGALWHAFGHHGGEHLGAERAAVLDRFLVQHEAVLDLGLRRAPPRHPRRSFTRAHPLHTSPTPQPNAL